MQEKNIILKTIVGSRAHGLHNENSDFDYRGVWVAPTSKILSLGSTQKQTSWIEGNIDDTSWEIGKFLHLATKCNPTILETFVSPRVNPETNEAYNNLPEHDLGTELRDLFPHIWNSTGVRDAFIGYGLNQRKKFLDNTDNLAPKYATAYLRTLYNAWELLSTGTFSADMTKTPILGQLRSFKAGIYSIGEVIQTCSEWQVKVEQAYKQNPDKKTNIEVVNEFLLKVRKNNW